MPPIVNGEAAFVRRALLPSRAAAFDFPFSTTIALAFSS
jgi:hypothetical protein